MNLVCFFLEQIGPNVSISANVRVGAGVRLISCIILDDVEIKVQDWI
jgi:mannose-1-phosphate guanylyltransferase